MKVLQKGKVTIPVKIREMLGIKEGDTITLEIRGGYVVILPPRTVLNPTKLIDGLAEGVSLKEPIEEELKKAAATRIKKKLMRSKR
jgi:AbrB family looped-hinge helix DNA binding protein